DFGTRELSRGGKVVHLEPKALALLELLIAARPKAISKSRLQDALWPKTYVSEKSLAGLVGDLRLAIGDRARKPRYIRTVHRFGYAFCGEVAAGSQGRSVFHYRLVWEGQEIMLSPGEYLLGREPGVAVWIDDSEVSRRHARIVVGADGATLEDLGSKNGTKLRGERIRSVSKLTDRDETRIGWLAMIFHVHRKRGSPDTAVGSETPA